MSSIPEFLSFGFISGPPEASPTIFTSKFSDQLRLFLHPALGSVELKEKGGLFWIVKVGILIQGIHLNLIQ